jgi:uncharacterized protein (UPF0303 family)
MSRTVPTYTVAELEYLNDIDLVEFGNDDAVQLGRIAVDVITERDLNLAVDVVLGDDLVFRAKLKATGPGNDSWLPRSKSVTTSTTTRSGRTAARSL